MDRSTGTVITTTLRSLIHENLRKQVAFAGTPVILREALLATNEIHQLREGLRSGAISDAEVREFVDQLLSELRHDVRFPEDFALAGIAVGFETHHSPLAQEYLKDLSSLRLRELSIASGVARESLKHRLSSSLESRTTTGVALDGGNLTTGSRELVPRTSETKNTLKGNDVSVSVVFDQRFVTYERAAA